LEEFRFFRLPVFIDFGDVPVGDLLETRLGAALFVVGDSLVVLGLAQVIEGVAADVAHGDARIFRLLVHGLDEFLAASFRPRPVRTVPRSRSRALTALCMRCSASVKMPSIMAPPRPPTNYGTSRQPGRDVNTA